MIKVHGKVIRSSNEQANEKIYNVPLIYRRSHIEIKHNKIKKGKKQKQTQTQHVFGPQSTN